MKLRQTSNIKGRIVVATIVFVVAVLFWRFLPTPGELVSETIFRPLLQGETVLNNLVRGQSDPLSDEESNELDYLRAENTSLREVLGQSDEPRIAAGVIGRPSALPYDILMIDKGSDDGIKKDTPIYIGRDTVIGFVAETYQNSSLVALLSTPGFTSTAYIFGPNIYTTAVGIGGGVTRIHVPQGITLSVGDLVVLPSMSPGLYGTVNAVDSVPERAEQYGYLTTDIPISSLKVVAVGTRPLSVMEFNEARKVVEETRREFLTIDVPDEFLIEAQSSTSTATSTQEGVDAESSTETDVEINTVTE
ncbi:hypothetical protein H6788_02170 [Candidatus Nomurabacteria bacterium]|nr:hypothetical protein [Candidatus Nomurabacteria bacterium]MCB9819146.1 hypothetical protein [Candidatus Nomurabacteria bacterium]